MNLDNQTSANLLFEELSKTPRRRIFVMELSDGKNTVTAIEYEALDALSNQRPGCKMSVHGSVRLKHNVLLLNPQNCQFLGGYVAQLVDSDARVRLKRSAEDAQCETITPPNNAKRPTLESSMRVDPSNNVKRSPLDSSMRLVPSTKVPPSKPQPAKMNVNVEELVSFFKERHIMLKLSWLQAVLSYFQMANKSPNELHAFIYHQWLHQDLKITTDFPTRAQKKICIFQIVSIADISTTVFDQQRNPGLPINSLLDEFPKTPRTRILLMELSDGKNTVTAIEHEALVTLTNQRVGCKIGVYGNVRLNNTVLLLNPQNCQVLGGQVAQFLSANARLK